MNGVNNFLNSHIKEIDKIIDSSIKDLQNQIDDLHTAKKYLQLKPANLIYQLTDLIRILNKDVTSDKNERILEKLNSISGHFRFDDSFFASIGRVDAKENK